MADIKISELEPTTDLEGLYTIGSDKNNLSKKVSLQFLKDAANYANEQGDYAKQAGDTVNGNVGVSDYPEFSASQSYVIGDIVRYNGVLYSFTANHAASAWNGSDVKATSINAITSGKLTELESENIYFAKGDANAYYNANRVVELYLVGLAANTKYYLDRCKSYSSGASMQIYIKDDNDNLVAAYDGVLSSSMVILAESNKSGISGYAIVKLTAEDTLAASVELNKNIVSSLDFSPCICVKLKNNALESEINKIPHPIFANNVPYITELYVTDVGKEVGVGMILIVQNTESSRLVSFATKDGSAYAGITNTIDGTNILKIVDRGNPSASPIYGYILVDWTQIEGSVSPQQLISDTAYSLDNSPSIKSYILENAIKEDIKQSENSTKAEIKKIESKIDGKADYTPIVYSNNIWNNNLINKCLVDGSYELGKYIGQDGSFSDAPTKYKDIFACSDYIEIKEGDVIVGRLVYLDESEQFAIGAFYDADKNLLSSFYNSQISSKSYTLIAPKNAAYIRFTLFTNVMQNYICINPNVVTPHSAKGKKINYLGDSITVGAYTDGVAQRYTNVVAAMTESESINLGASGTLIGGKDSSAFCNRLYTLDMDADALIVFGGTNDYWTANALGEIKSTNKEETCGAVNYIIDYWQTNCPKKPIAFILPFNQYFKSKDCEWNNGYGTLQDYCNAIKSVCERKGVPVLNLYSESGMNMAFNETQRTMFSADGVHPNVEGHYIIARKVVDFLNKLFA